MMVCYSFGVVIFLFDLCTDASGYNWTTIPPDLTKVQGQAMLLTWIIDLSDTIYFTTEVRQWKGSNKLDIIFTKYDTQPTVETPFLSRSSDLSFTVTQSGNVMSATFNLSNLVKSTDEAEYDLIVTTQKGDTSTVTRKTRLTINVPPTITSQHPITISSIESQTVQLVCNATGFPTPSINWTRNGVVVGTGSPFHITAKSDDHNQCYTCVAYNGVYGAKSANVCLAIQYKPVGPHQVTSDRSTVCQNDNVTLTCTSGPANPAATKYKFYYNHVLVQNSSSNVYVTQATHGHPNVNRFTCVPSNLVGDSLQNGTEDVVAKVTPFVTLTSKDLITMEKSNLTLTCNVSGTPPFNVNWTKPGKSSVQGMVYSITNINRHDEGVYRCTVNNGGECPTHSATINVTVNFPPGRPIITVTDIEATSVIVRWTKPIYDGGSPVILYNLTIDSKTYVIDAPNTHKSISGLTKNTKYEVQLYAKNIAGYGNASNTIFTTKGPPYLPEVMAYVEQTFVKLNWSKREESGGKITKYTIYKKVNESWTKIVDVTTTSYTVEDLQPGMRYSFLVTASNQYGESLKDDSRAKTVVIPITTTAATGTTAAALDSTLVGVLSGFFAVFLIIVIIVLVLYKWKPLQRKMFKRRGRISPSSKTEQEISLQSSDVSIKHQEKHIPSLDTAAQPTSSKEFEYETCSSSSRESVKSVID